LLRADTFSDLQVFAESLYTVQAKNEHPRESTLDFKRGRTESSAEQTLNAQELAVLKLILNILTCLLQIEAESKFDRLQLYLSRFKTRDSGQEANTCGKTCRVCHPATRHLSQRNSPTEEWQI
ncbi:hypothetical protein CLAIMM_02351, partial [Cladophialophora immunda]